jgi:K+-sensing histidine kinase KdpD
MPHIFNQREINTITDDLRIFLGAVKGPIDKLDYFTNKVTGLEAWASIELEYQFDHIDIIPEVENAVIQQLDLADKMQASIQLHLSPASLMVNTDRLFFQQIFFRLLVTLLEANEKNSVISVYVNDSDGKCMIEVIEQSDTFSVKGPDDYFKKYRINNTSQSQSVPKDNLLWVYKLMIEDMGGELAYSFAKERANYFRLKFTIG